MKNSNNRSMPFTCTFLNSISKERLKKNILLITVINFVWLFFRTGFKPSRITYPCQRAALSNLSITLNAIIPHFIITSFLTSLKTFFPKSKALFLIVLVIGVISGGLLFKPHTRALQEIQLSFDSKQASSLPASDLFVVTGPNAAHFPELITLMSSNGLFFYQSNTDGVIQNINGLIAQNDVVLLKINSQWPARGGTNTDLLKEVIQAIIDHPDGFTGEIVVADNGQGRGDMDFDGSNAENISQSTQEVVDLFSSAYNVSTYDWQNIRRNSVNEYSEGDMSDGYIVYNTPDLETGIYVSYPKFETEFGTQISFKQGIWNGMGYEKRLKIINMPVLKSHTIYGVTASVKNYMGVQTEILGGGLANGHETVATGGMGTLMVECGLPTLNILDAIWVNANPSPSPYVAPSTSYYMATRVNTLLAGVDPIALDFWAAKNILMETARIAGFSDDYIQSFDPTNNETGQLDEAFGVWLNFTKEELNRGGFNVTTNEDRMNVFVFEDHSPISSSTSSSTSQMPSNSSIKNSTRSPNQTTGFGVVLLVSSSMVITFFTFRRQKTQR